MIGYLSPEAILYECKSYEHITKAHELCKSIYNLTFPTQLMAENYLLSLGYLVLRERNAFMMYATQDNKVIILNEEQIGWLSDHMLEMTVGQNSDISRILNEQELVKNILQSSIQQQYLKERVVAYV